MTILSVAPFAVDRPTAIVVLGAPIGGGAMLRRVLNEFGFALPKSLPALPSSIEPATQQPAGLITLLSEFYGATGSDWDDWRVHLPPAGSASEFGAFRRNLKSQILKEFKGRRHIAIDNTGLCRFAGLIHEVLSQVGYDVAYIIIVRRPGCVIDGLIERHGLASGHASLVWLRHMVDAERETRDHRRFILPYDNFMTDWRTEMSAISEQLGLAWGDRFAEKSKIIDEMLSLEAGREGFFAAEPDSPSIRLWSEKMFGALFSASQSELTHVEATIEEISAEFSEFSRTYGDAMFGSVLRERVKSRSAMTALNRRIAELDASARDYAEALALSEQKIDAVSAELAHEAASSEAVATELTELRSFRTTLDGILAIAAKKVGFVQSDFLSFASGKAGGGMGLGHNSRVLLQANEALEVVAELLERNGALEKARQDLAGAQASIAELELKLLGRAEDSQVLRQQLAVRNEEASRLKDGRRHVALELMRIIEANTAQIQELQRDRDQAVSLAATYTASTSWKITAPFRWIRRRLKV